MPPAMRTAAERLPSGAGVAVGEVCLQPRVSGGLVAAVKRPRALSPSVTAGPHTPLNHTTQLPTSRYSVAEWQAYCIQAQ